MRYQLRVADGSSGLADQKREEFELDRRKFEGDARAQRLMFLHQQFDVSGDEAVTVGGGELSIPRAAQYGPQSSGQFDRAYGHEEIVVGAGFESPHNVLLLTAHRADHDG